jgi:hypothetical protein
MAEGPRMTAAQLADKLLASEHADVLRRSMALMVAELMEAEAAAKVGAELGQRIPDPGRPAQRLPAPILGHPGGGWSCASPGCGPAATSPGSWSRAAAPSRPWPRWCRRPTPPG